MAWIEVYDELHRQEFVYLLQLIAANDQLARYLDVNLKGTKPRKKRPLRKRSQKADLG